VNKKRKNKASKGQARRQGRGSMDRYAVRGNDTSLMSNNMLHAKKDQQIKELSESLFQAREEQQEFDSKMQQVTNLLKELKNN